MDLSMLLAFIPEPWRTYVVAVLVAFLATQVVASAIVAVLPAGAFKWRPLRALSWYAHLAPRDAAGTFKLPFRAPMQPGAMEDLARLQSSMRSIEGMLRTWVLPNTPPEQVEVVARTIAESLARQSAPAAPAAPRETQAPPPPSGQSGRVTLASLLVLLVVSAGLGCPRLPPVVGCTPGAYRCTDDGRPQACSSTQRWEPIGDESCAAGGAVCVVERTAHCAPMQITADGGSDAR